MSSIHKFTLDNGVRILVEPISHVRSAAIGLWCKTGSRHETDQEAGITHLIEHMLFKGTATRTAKEIAESIEGRGGSLNAFTDKESTCYYCRVLAGDAANGVDVLSDMMLHSLIDPEELAREQGVVLEEIKRSQDEPSDFVHDLHLHERWGNHPLGKPVIGTPESVASFSREDVLRYMDRRYRAENVMLSIAGNVDPNEVVEVAKATLGKIPHTTTDDQPSKPAGTRKTHLLTKDVEQVHFCIGTDAVSLFDDRLYPLAVMDAALGGSMSSRLFQEIREKRGLAYSVGSYSLTYGAGGAFTVYGGTSLEHWPLVQELIHAAFKDISESGLAEAELERTKRNICGSIVLGLENMSGRMMRMSKNELHHDREISVEESLEKINQVTNDSIRSLCAQIFQENLISTTAIGPFSG
jgi:predicted Zn-dependent peptidase